MQIFYGTENLPFIENAVLTIGTFDGIHQGHQRILSSVVAVAKEKKGSSILITFEPHPRKLIYPNEPLQLLNTLEERLQLVAAVGIDITVVVPFTKEFARLSAQDYIEDFLVKIFQPAAIVIGYDHHFGNDRKGNIELLKTFSEKYNFEVKEISAQLISDAIVSSTKVRKALLAGDVAIAHKMLDTPYSLVGTVVRGAQRGRNIGYPTANIAIPFSDKLIPKIGVYAVLVFCAAKQYNGMLNIGTNPTVTDDKSLKIEVNIFDFDQDIYNEKIEIQFLYRLRDEQKFNNIQELKTQLAQDEQLARDLLEK